MPNCYERHSIHISLQSDTKYHTVFDIAINPHAAGG